MKKLTFAALVGIIAGTLASCGGQAPRASLKNDIDTLSYTLGITQAQGLRDYLVQSLGIDTAYFADFIKGMNEGVNAGDSKKKAAYIAGLNIGQQISNQMIPRINRQVFGEDTTQTISQKNYMSGFITTTTNGRGLMTIEEATAISDSMMHIIQAREMEKVYGENRIAGEQFLAENATKDDIKTLEGGVQYRVITEGNGPIPADTSVVVVDYEGRLLDGTVFDSSYKRGQPTTFPCNQVIKGWTTALCHMPVGSKWEVFIPQELAYGERMTGQIKPFSMLIFTIELREIKEK